MFRNKGKFIIKPSSEVRRLSLAPEVTIEFYCAKTTSQTMKWDPLEMTLYRRVAGRYWCNKTPHNVEGGVVTLTCVSWQNGATLLCTSIGEICLATGISNLFQGHQRVLTQTARCLKVCCAHHDRVSDYFWFYSKYFLIYKLFFDVCLLSELKREESLQSLRNGPS